MNVSDSTAAYDSTTAVNLLPECKPDFRPDLAIFQAVVFVDVSIVVSAVVKGIAIGAVGLGFNSRFGQDSANGSPPLLYFFGTVLFRR